MQYLGFAVKDTVGHCAGDIRANRAGTSVQSAAPVTIPPHAPCTGDAAAKAAGHPSSGGPPGLAEEGGPSLLRAPAPVLLMSVTRSRWRRVSGTFPPPARATNDPARVEFQHSGVSRIGAGRATPPVLVVRPANHLGLWRPVSLSHAGVVQCAAGAWVSREASQKSGCDGPADTDQHDPGEQFAVVLDS
jgi:hypothetical protein